MENLEQLKKLGQIFNSDKIVTQDEVEQVLNALITILANNKKGIEKLTEEQKAELEKTVNFVMTEMTKMQGEHEADHKKMNTEMAATMANTLRKCQGMMDEMLAMKPVDGNDGKDCNPADVVPLVMEQIKLPKAFILEGKGDQVVSEINKLPTDDEELKIDASHIKNLPEIKSENGRPVFAVAPSRNQVQVYDLSSSLDGVTKTFGLPAFWKVFDVRSSSFPYAFRPTVDYTVDGSAMTITFTSEVEAAGTLATGQTLYVLYTTA